MNHADHVALIREGVSGGGTTWADLGSGSGAFTLALADLLGAEGTIHSVDRDESALRQQARAVAGRFPEVVLRQHAAEFSQSLDLPQLDGIVMANSLHFVRDKQAVLSALLAHLREGGRFVLVEYDTDQGNQWVPQPLSYRAWEELAAELGLRETRRLASVPSRFLGSIYSALSILPRTARLAGWAFGRAATSRAWRAPARLAGRLSLQVQGQAERREQALGVEEEGDPADPPVGDFQDLQRPWLEAPISRGLVLGEGRRAIGRDGHQAGAAAADTGPQAPLDHVLVSLQPEVVGRHVPRRVFMQQRGERLHVVALEPRRNARKLGVCLVHER